MEIPKWRRGDLTDRLDNHMNAESIYERQVGDVLQVVERVVSKDRPTQVVRPFYRLVEVKNGKARAIRTAELRIADTQREVRAAADRRARKILRRLCDNCERCTWNPGPDCGRADHEHCDKCGHCLGRHYKIAAVREP